MAQTREKLGFKAVLAELKANGSEQTRKIYRSAGGRGDMYGVSYAFLKKLNKRVKVDHDLALRLWETGNHDARVFACWTADSERTTVKLVEAWARDDSNPLLSGELAAFVQDTSLAAGRMRKWIGMKGEYRRTMGWNIAAKLVMQPNRGPEEGGLEESEIGDLLQRLEDELQSAPNEVRYAMNNALIAIGCRPGWMKKAISAARKIGKVEVDFGSRQCKVNDAADTIKKTVEHYKKQGKNPTDGSAGKRRRHC
ncbi:MAG: hypothetical protein DWQ01_00780 [Planctomycetota bacterium]|nr:MAG: hypothetical protein DWQ01_00780 [Planctomycetota bacterium]